MISPPSWFAVYNNPRILAVAVLGFVSGLPLALSFSTLSVWMTESGIDKTTIGLFAALGIPYSIKFLWAPLVDQLSLGPLTRRCGRRRGWLLLVQALLISTLLLLGSSDPVANPWWVALLALTLSTLSATQDIIIDAYRVELLEDHQQGAGAAAVVFGYRIGMLTSGAGALFIAHYADWFTAYATMAAILPIGLVVTWLMGDDAQQHSTRDIATWIREAVVEPFRSFIRSQHPLYILTFIVLYKLGDAFAGVMTYPFLVDIGFSKPEIATIVKSYGLGATLVGAFIGGSLVANQGIWKSLFIAGVLQMLSNLLFIWQAQVGHDSWVLIVTITGENLAGGLGTAAFVAYISALCQRQYTATQYALFSALASLGRTTFSASSGAVVDTVGWVHFFGFSALLALPGIVMLWKLKRIFSR